MTDVFPKNDSMKVLQAMAWCQLHPEQSCTIDMEKRCKEGCDFFRWVIYAEQAQGKVSGVHLIGQFLHSENFA